MNKKHRTEYYYSISAMANNRIVVIDASSVEDLVHKLKQGKLNWDYIKLQKSVITHDTDKKEGCSIVSKKYSKMLVARAGSDESRMPKVDFDLTKNGVVPQNIKDFFLSKQKGSK